MNQYFFCGFIILVLKLGFAAMLDIWSVVASFNSEWQILEHEIPKNTSLAAIQLGAYLKNCTEVLSSEAGRVHLLEFAEMLMLYTEGFAEVPTSESGKYIHCLAKHPRMKTMAMFYYGFPGPNGAISAGIGLHAREKEGKGLVRLITAEGNEEYCANGKTLLSKFGLDRHVQLLCKMVCPDSDDKVGCLSEVKRDYCPSGRLDVLFIDPAGPGDTGVWSALEACTPKVIMIANSGITQTQPAWGGGTFSRYKDEGIHEPALAGQGNWRIVVNRHLHKFPFESTFARSSLWQQSQTVWRLMWIAAADAKARQFWTHPRRFSVYIAADDNV
eukprot:gnl/TRDRNA2_/TRDRNA2_205373_c0_seq1.p1 gnl/TRDRNA2_/TRDRNA2_205373_c0~~gnl/TRDRNA2_/TRDRNA2_205373_c0_seq1.p1  ORF type:complete len:329 (-),score=30.33 gnl/TRDRNA2_/TRDRNA2_205373_c0_seq1:10-996(-)